MNPPQHLRRDYPHFQPITTRWHDNDIYGHVNNVTYYSYFDSAVNAYLIEVGGLDIHNGEVVGFVVSSSCDYFASIAFPERIEIGLRVAKLGNSSVQYELACSSRARTRPARPGVSSMCSSSGRATGRCRFLSACARRWRRCRSRRVRCAHRSRGRGVYGPTADAW